MAKAKTKKAPAKKKVDDSSPKKTIEERLAERIRDKPLDPKKAPPGADLRPGQTKHYKCGECGRDYEICLFPKAKEGKSIAGLQPGWPSTCPFCTGDDVSCLTLEELPE